jgi:glycosyltransferase involved in cell wall biosynthesis
VRILQIFNPYVNFGGEESAVNQISVQLEKHHELCNVFFDIHGWAGRTGMLNRSKQFVLMAWNPGSVGKVREAIAGFKPDVILIHNIMPIGSAALYYYLSRCGVPVVQYIHNFRPFSVNGYCWGDGRILTEGLDRNFFPEIAAGAWQESRLKTAWYGVLIWALHGLGVYRRISGWIAISRFMKDAFVSGGIAESRIEVIPHSWEPTNPVGDQMPKSDHREEPQFFFLGRLSEEKGLRVLLDAWEMHEQSGGRGRLRIAGEGPLADEVLNRCGRLERAEYLGFRGGKDKEELLASCRALIVPSVWWEPLGLVLYEAYDHAKPVLAARSGGIVDHVTDGDTGWVHEPGNVGQLASHIREASENPEEATIRGRRGRKQIELRNANRWIGEISAFLESVASGAIAAEEPKSALRTTIDDGPVRAQVYLADQNPGYDRSFGISRMSHMVLNSLQGRGNTRIEVVVSESSQTGPENVNSTRSLPWGTRKKWVRLLSDHLHPLFVRLEKEPDLYYFPKGYLPLLDVYCRPSVVTIHDTIIQYDEDHYPDWRSRWEYGYWAWLLKHTLRNADRILTVSESSKSQISGFMQRHGIPEKKITVTYEPCAYETIPQPDCPAKDNKVIHLASIEPHKRTAHLIRWWLEAESERTDLPGLELIGSVPDGLSDRIRESRTIRLLPFLEDAELQEAYSSARALLLPSEIEGFGLPALEAYYLGTPVCFVKGTSVEEILSGATSKGAFSLEDRDSFFAALDEAMAMDPAEIRKCGLKLRETFDSEKVAERIESVFEDVRAASR